MAEDAAAEAAKLQARGYRVADAGDFQGALLLFRKASELQPTSGDLAAVHKAAELAELVAQCLLQLERWDDAHEAAMQAHALDPSWLDGAVTLGRAARNAAYLKDAVSAFRAASALGGGDEELAGEAAEVEGLWRQRIAKVIGLPELRVTEEWGKGAGGPGSVIWDCGVMLAAHLVGTLGPEGLKGKRVLELGSGTGIAGIAAAACGADVTLTDLPAHLPNLKGNVERNRALVEGGGGSLATAQLDWARGEAGVADLPGGRAWDIVLGADLLYSEAAVAPLGTVLRAILAAAPQNPTFLLAHKQRTEEVDVGMLELFRSAGLPLHVIEAGEQSAEQEQRLLDWSGGVNLYSSAS